MKKILIVNKEQSGIRLDLFLSLELNQYTRSFIKKQVNDNRVKVNGEVEYRGNYKVRTGDKVGINFEEIKKDGAVKPEKIALEILYEDNDLIAVNKPEGMVVHPANGNDTGTLVNALLYKYKDMKNVGERIRAGLINRIDKDSSGIVLVGKTNKALWFYSRQLANREMQKRYLAVTAGDFSKMLKDKDSITISNYLARNPKNRVKFAVVDPGKGRLAISNFKLLDVSKDKKYSLVEADIETGRTHQIRVHLSSIGYPIVGDKVYSKIVYKRLLLHSYKIGLTLLDGKDIEIVAKVEGEYRKFLNENFNNSKIVQYT